MLRKGGNALRYLLCLPILVIALGCQVAPGARATVHPAHQEPSLAPTSTRTPVPPDMVVAVEAARRDLEKRMALDTCRTCYEAAAVIRVLSVEAVQWPDASLGCPEPGRTYDAVMTPGYRIVLELEGKEYTYHTERGSRAVLCQDGRPAPPPKRAHQVALPTLSPAQTARP